MQHAGNQEKQISESIAKYTVEGAMEHVKLHGVEHAIFEYRHHTWMLREAFVELIKQRQGRISLFLFGLIRLPAIQGVLDGEDLEYLFKITDPSILKSLLQKTHHCFGKLTPEQKRKIKSHLPELN